MENIQYFVIESADGKDAAQIAYPCCDLKRVNKVISALVGEGYSKESDLHVYAVLNEIKN